MQIIKRGITLLSQLKIDSDLDMGAHALKVDTIVESKDAGVKIEDIIIDNHTIISEYLYLSWDVSKAGALQVFSVAGEETEPKGIFFKPDGTKMYIVGSQVGEVNEYDLATPWDVSSAVFLQLLSVVGEETAPDGVFFKPDGTKMYIVGTEVDEVNEYDLATPWDVSSAVFLQVFSVAGEEATPRDIFFKPDGTKMYIPGAAGVDVTEYDLATPWDVSSAVFLQVFSVAGEEASPESIFFKPDGTKMYITGTTNDNVNEYDLATPWDVSSAVFLQLLSIVGEEAEPKGISFKPDGTKMYITGTSGRDVNEYDLYC